MPEPDAAGPPPADVAPAAVPAEVKPAPSLASGRRIEYIGSLRFIFAHRDWLKNGIILGVFLVIPVLSVPVLFGYTYEIVEMLHRRKAAPYPLFEVRRFAVYVTRGIWCYLVANIVAAILTPLIQVVAQGGMFGTMAAIAAIQADQTVGTIITAIVAPLLIIGLILFFVGLGVVLTPIYIRAGLSQDFAQTFKFRWIADFVKRMWLETILTSLFILIVSLVLLPVGCMIACYGFLVVAALLSIASGHLAWQLYELYLARGGEPIPLKPLPADVPPVVSGP